MRIYLKTSIVIVLSCILAACQTTESNKYDPENPAYLTSSRDIGLFVGYSEICAQFQGVALDNKVLGHYRSFYRGNSSFQAGYRHNADLAGSDFVTGLHNCEYVNASLLKTYNQDFKTPKKKVFTLTDVPHILNVSWIDRSANSQHSFKLSQKGKKGRAEGIVFDGDKLCNVSFLFEDQKVGRWDLLCISGETGEGTFRFSSQDNVTIGTGKTSFGGPITFVMRRDKA